MLSIPVIFGAALLTIIDINSLALVKWDVLFIGFFCSFFVGIFALKWLLNWLESGRFFLFGFYCLLAGAIMFFYHH